jgi:Domain of unknown function (DUF4134)
MLHQLSWGAFFSTIGWMVTLYYLAIGAIFLRKPLIAWVKKKLPMTVLLVALVCHAHAQTADGNNGLSEANTLIRSYFTNATQVMYAIGGLVGLVGAIRVFLLWNGGHHQEIGKAAAGWFGSCIFLVVVALIIQSFFGL